MEKLKELGNNMVTLTRLFNIREGITSADNTLPRRFFEQPLPEWGTKGRTMNKERFMQMVREN